MLFFRRETIKSIIQTLSNTARLFANGLLSILFHQPFNAFEILWVILHRQATEYFQSVSFQLIAFHHDFDGIVFPLVLSVEKFGYPSKKVDGHVIPQPEHLASTEEESWLIEAAHILAADLGIILQE